MRAAICFLFPGTPDNIYKGGVSTELNGALGNREDTLRLCKHYLGIGAIARANLSVTDSCHGGLYLKLVSAIVLYSLGNLRSCSAPTVIFIGMPSTSLPTSVSSIFPRNIRSFILATVAMVVPSLKVLLSTTVFPTFTGTSSMSPEIVERMSVELALALLFDTPSRTTSSASCAAAISSRA